MVLILGTDARRPGARAWAASRPNLLFFIGNRDAWRDQRFFAALADTLPTHDWRRG
ncbi:hypothetical protein ACFC08_19240 [Streptomyces sp. NPDC056112]|uniref:hypothetical protein n=1 Tax=unclassified Streptomyces TaxID=2593676 RepID=UPI0011749508|nr:MULTISPECIES: hypothetical protein [unclassified Streptomyces]GED88660.1 hypothetical protein TNCT6_57450 [Streptomyces sp. 6-11-2]